MAAGEVKFGLQPISEGVEGRGTRVNTGSMHGLYYNLATCRCKQCTLTCWKAAYILQATKVLEGKWYGNEAEEDQHYTAYSLQ